MAACCQAGASGTGRKLTRITSSVMPAVVLLILPKCPMCLAAWLTLATGLSFSAAGATWVRMGTVVVWLAAVVHVAWSRVLARRTA